MLEQSVLGFSKPVVSVRSVFEKNVFPPPLEKAGLFKRRGEGSGITGPVLRMAQTHLRLAFLGRRRRRSVGVYRGRGRFFGTFLCRLRNGNRCGNGGPRRCTQKQLYVFGVLSVLQF